MERLKDRGIVVTGATGIAEASARLFAAEGGRVFVISRTEANCRALAESIVESGGTAAYAAADLIDAEAAEAAVQASVAWLGRIDGLFNVAGGSGRGFGDGPLHTLTADAWERTMELNATSHVLVSAPVIRQMLKQEPDDHGERGAIVNTSSVLASSPVAGLFATHAYAASKGAINALTITAAAHYASDRIRINAVAPALTTSRMSERAAANAETAAFSQRKQPLSDGFIAAREIAAAALYLLSPESSAMTGQILTIDGGWSVTSTS
jgi:NAD(P)-dependent dehydrogenase (short-subunit alcohol dehydrogenase family)